MTTTPDYFYSKLDVAAINVIVRGVSTSVRNRQATFPGLVTVLPASASTITVCPSGCDDTSINAASNAAIGAANDGDMIQLSAETYFEGEQIDTLGKAITLRGGRDHLTSIVEFGGDTGGNRVFSTRKGIDGDRLAHLRRIPSHRRFSSHVSLERTAIPIPIPILGLGHVGLSHSIAGFGMLRVKDRIGLVM